MELEFFDKNLLIEQIIEILSKYINLDDFDVFFFGSRVNYKNRLSSDIDIGLEGKEKIPLNILNTIKYELDRKVKTLYTFDIVDFKRVDQEFKKIVQKRIEFIHARKNY